MRKNNVLLATAIAATLVASMNASYAGLMNYPGCNTATTLTAHAGTNVPNDIFCKATIAANAIAPAMVGNPVAGTGVITQSLVPMPATDKGIIYGTHLFGSNGDSLTLPSGTNYADAKWTIEGTPTGKLQIIAILTGASFNGNPILAFEGTSNPLNTSTTPTGGGTSIPDFSQDCIPASFPTKCTWRFGNSTDTSISNGNAFHILYQLTKAATTLGTNGGAVKLEVQFGTSGSATIMGDQTIPVATGQDPFTVQFKGTDNTYIKVAVAEENKAFVTQKPTALGVDSEFLGANSVIFGYMYMQPNNYVKINDGYTDWAFNIASNPITKAGYDSTASVLTTLTLSDNGQFAASTGNNGGVFLHARGQDIAAKSIKDTDAVWQLTDANLADMMMGTTDTGGFGQCKSGDHCIPLYVKVDGNTAINIPPEDGPKVQFSLDYASLKKGLKYPADADPVVLLTRYIQDGVSCWVFNVPFPDAVDELNLRIINDSTITPTGTDCVWGTLYGKDGKPVGKKTSLGCPGKEGTLYIGSEKLWGSTTLPAPATPPATPGLFTATGGSRGSMFITSTLAKMEVMAMLRLKSPPCFGNVPGGCNATNSNPLTNLSTGAHGVACAPNYR